MPKAFSWKKASEKNEVKKKNVRRKGWNVLKKNTNEIELFMCSCKGSGFQRSELRLKISKNSRYLCSLATEGRIRIKWSWNHKSKSFLDQLSHNSNHSFNYPTEHLPDHFPRSVSAIWMSLKNFMSNRKLFSFLQFLFVCKRINDTEKSKRILCVLIWSNLRSFLICNIHLCISWHRIKKGAWRIEIKSW